MQINLIKIGNSRGVRLPKAIIEQACLGDRIDLEVADHAVILRPCSPIRKGWEEAAEECNRCGDDSFRDWDVTTADIEDDWQ